MKISLSKVLSALTLALAVSPALMARTIQGTVTNMTVNKPSVGDKVTLLSLSAGLDELSSTKTDGKGHFSLNTPADEPYLVRVEHDNGAYFKNVPPGVTQADITVYDVAAKVDGVSTEADVMRVEADNGQLHVTENYFVKNVSSPPRTQSSDHTFEVVLPADAVLEGAATTGPANMPISATPDPVNPKGHYAFSYPIRPNEGENGTRFQLSYHLNYNGSFKFSPREMGAVDNVAIILPTSMKFEPGSGTSYQTVNDGTPGAQTFLMRGVHPGQALDFTVSGTGSFPRDNQAGADQSAQSSADNAGNGPNGRPGGGLGNPIDTPDPLSKYKWWILSGLALVLVAVAAFLLRKPSDALEVAPANPGVATVLGSASTSAAIPVASNGRTRNQLLLDALKEELFSIESEKIAGTLSAEEYAEVKPALETVLRRALKRQG